MRIQSQSEAFAFRIRAGGLYPPTRGYDDLISQVRHSTGLNLSPEMMGGNNYVLSGRLDDGSWLVASDHDDFIHNDAADRVEREKEYGPQGWMVGIYPNVQEADPDTGEVNNYWGFDPEEGNNTDPVHHHAEPDAHLHELPGVVSRALASTPHGAVVPPREKHLDSGVDYSDLNSFLKDSKGKKPKAKPGPQYKHWKGPPKMDFQVKGRPDIDEDIFERGDPKQIYPLMRNDANFAGRYREYLRGLGGEVTASLGWYR